MKQSNQAHDYAILRLLFLREIEAELKKLSKKKYLNAKKQKYQDLLLKLQKQLQQFQIHNNDLKINKLAFDKIKREQIISKLKWYFIAGLLVFLLTIGIVIYLV
ncbi:hypothetical protein MBVR141_0439 [Mycoplasmopsis bovirhinis]|uniref:hypothetical protein n=1 Tax=Mycoplasmopsis bovirhinis TaxID=29553 RepID=UPI000BB9EFAF|nr:hypothetical protein [Mycoplasmopsis bovirhinis]BBA22304.1 hypothetical protein MBVR141_0439 [Mycoplasmopsis bovirhinis]